MHSSESCTSDSDMETSDSIPDYTSEYVFAEEEDEITLPKTVEDHKREKGKFYIIIIN